MAVGNFGSLIVFTVSDRKVLTFKNLSKTVKGRWGTLTPVWGRPVSYFQGADLVKITFEVQLDATLGVRPKKIMKRIEKAVENGKTQYLVIGGMKLCKHRMKITEATEAYDVVMRNGEIVKATVTLTLEECV